jgi:hypothetical protein
MKAQFFLFNIEGYGEFFSGITPRYSSSGFFPMQSIFYLKPQGHQIRA